MLPSFAHPSRSVVAFTALGALAAVVLHAPARGVAACPASPAPHVTRTGGAETGSLVRTASDGRIARDGRCTDPQLPPLALVASALALFAVPRCRQRRVEGGRQWEEGWDSE